MPKRTNEESIRRCWRKLRRLQAHRRNYNRIVYSTGDSGSDRSDSESCEESVVNSATEPTPAPPTAAPQLEPAVLSALGEVTEEAPTFGPKIHEKLTNLWLPLLKKGLNKDDKDKLTTEYTIPENCSLLQAPKLNSEISGVITEVARTRDKQLEAAQQQLGQGIAALNRGLEALLTDDGDKLQAIRALSDSCRILSDLHHKETKTRQQFITPGLDKTFAHVIQHRERDDLLFGKDLAEKIVIFKATKTIKKQISQVKKLPPSPTYAHFCKLLSTPNEPPTPTARLDAGGERLAARCRCSSGAEESAGELRPVGTGEVDQPTSS